MPIWSEILVLSLAAYAIGVGAGWLIWGADVLSIRQSDTGASKDKTDNESEE
jgi:hypothetical protein